MAHQCVAALLAEQATEKTRAVTAAIDGLLRGQIAQRVIRELHIEHVHILERHPHAVLFVFGAAYAGFLLMMLQIVVRAVFG